MTPRNPWPGRSRITPLRAKITGLLAIGFAIAMLGLFAGVIVLSFQLLHGDTADNGPSSLEPVRLLGPEETVFSWGSDRCEDEDIPDLPARAFRDNGGRVKLITSHFINRRFVGPDLDRVRHECLVSMRSGQEADPAKFNDREWIGAPYTSDGLTVYALVHNEYQGHTHPGRCPSQDYFQCWYNAITLAVSQDGGNTYQDARPPPGHLVASLAYRYQPDAGPYGIFSPSNIVRRDDGYYYALVVAQEFMEQDLGTCVIRTKDLAEPDSWRAWSGSDFDVAMPSPYRSGLGPPSTRICKTVSTPEISTMHDSLTYNTYLDKYVLVGVSGDQIPGRRGVVSGIYYSVSDDLIEWSRRKLVQETELPWSYECGDSNPILYPSLLDPDSTSRNFETTGRRPYLYVTRFHYRDCTQTLNRDLIRVRLEFTK